MALRQLMISRKIEQRKASLAELLTQEGEFKTRAADLETSIEEAQNDEEIEAVEEEINKLDQEKEELEEKKSKLQGEISELEGELEQLNSKEPKNDDTNKVPQGRTKLNFEGGLRMKTNKYETREQMLERLSREEVREFYSSIANLAQEKRAVSGSELTIPESVIDMIQTRLGDYSTLYNEVTVQSLTGTARIIMDGAIPEGIWVEMTGALSEVSSSFSQTELDGYKVGGYIPVSNAILEDSMINLANYLETRLSMAIAKALDNAILNGTVAGKQPTGIITALAATGLETHNVTSDGTLKDIAAKMALIDDGDDGAPIGEVIAVMKRSLYYSKIAPQTFVTTADGRVVIQNANSPKLPDGTRIVFNQYVPDNTIVMGDFKKYLLGERKGVQLAASTDVRFVEDQTVFKGTARYDGKPIYPEYFVKITIEEPVA